MYIYLFVHDILPLRADLKVNSGIILADKRQFNASSTASRKKKRPVPWQDCRR